MRSLKELFRTGHGPSSSHTMAPAHAARIFRERFPGAASFDVTLFGSLAATGKGHFTDKAIMQTLAPHPVTFHWIPEKQLPFHPNAMEFKALDEANVETGKSIFYSTGGGALHEEGAPEENQGRSRVSGGTWFGGSGDTTCLAIFHSEENNQCNGN